MDPGGGERTWLLQNTMTIKATAAGTGGGPSLVESLVAAGFGAPLHVHHGDHEAYYVLAGTLDAGGRDRTSRPRPRRRSLTMPRILSKRALRDRIQAAVLAYETGLVQLGDG